MEDAQDDVTVFLPDASAVIQRVLMSPLGDNVTSDVETDDSDGSSTASDEKSDEKSKTSDDVIKEAVETLKVHSLDSTLHYQKNLAFKRPL